MAKRDPSNSVTPLPAGNARCPTCGKPSATRYRPFCSGRCADIDLGRWLKGVYAIPVAEAQDTDVDEVAEGSLDEKG